jgi:outer membrane immunogenic protein
MRFLWVGVLGVALATPATAQDWTGLYLGGHAGYAQGDVSVVDTDGGVPYGAFDYSPAGVIAGGTLGYNFNLGRALLVGIEGDLGYLELNGTKYIASSDPAHHQELSVDGGLYGDITGRLGLSLGRTLIYGKGGFAFYQGEAVQDTTKVWYTPTGTDTFTGWTAGGGIEHAISPNWSLKVEYLHFDFGSQSGNQTKTQATAPGVDDGTPVGYVFNNEHDLTVDTFKLGVNYHFGGAEPIAAPLK